MAAMMLPVAAGIGMAGESAERSYTSQTRSPGDSISQATDQSSGGLGSPKAAAGGGETQTRQTSKAADEKREADDSSDDHESQNPARTRSKSSTASAQSSAAQSAGAAQFAAVFADAVSAAGVQPTIQSQGKPQQTPASAPSTAQAGNGDVSGAATTAPLAAKTAPSAGSQAVASIALPAHLPSGDQAAATGQHLVGSHSAPAFAANVTLPSSADAAHSPANLSAPVAVQPAESSLPAGAQPASPAGGLVSAQASQAAGVAQSASGSETAAPAFQQSASAAPQPLAASSAPQGKRGVATGASASKGEASALVGRIDRQSLHVTPGGPQITAVGSKKTSEASDQFQAGADVSAEAGVRRQPGNAHAAASDQSDTAAVPAAAPLPGAAQGKAASTMPAIDNADAAIAQSSLQERIDVARQLAGRISAASAASGLSAALTVGARKLTVDISPQHWGRMQITLTESPADASGVSQASATIVTESASARQALLGQVKELRDSLQASGVKIDKIEIIAAAKSDAFPSAGSPTVASVAGAASGSLAGSGQQPSQNQQHHAHSGGGFDLASGSGGSSGDASGGQSGARQFSSHLADDSGSTGSYRGGAHPLGGAEAGVENSLALPGGIAGLDSGVNVLA